MSNHEYLKLGTGIIETNLKEATFRVAMLDSERYWQNAKVAKNLESYEFLKNDYYESHAFGEDEQLDQMFHDLTQSFEYTEE